MVNWKWFGRFRSSSNRGI